MLNQANYNLTVPPYFSQASQLDWWPLSRDIFWYLVSIILLFVVLYDAKVLMFEAIGLLSGYVVYVVALSYDRKIQKVFRSIETFFFKIKFNRDLKKLSDFLQMSMTTRTW